MLDVDDFAPCLDQRFFEAVDFLEHLVVGHDLPGDAMLRSAEHKDFSPANARGNGNSPEHFLSFMQQVCHDAALSKTMQVEKEFFEQDCARGRRK